jgi:hypothetical protein
MSEFVPETAIDYDEIFRRGGQNGGDEDFALFKCPACAQVYLLEYEIDTVYLDGRDLSVRVSVVDDPFNCTRCGSDVSNVELWAGLKAPSRFLVTWDELRRSDWAWAVRTSMEAGAP